MHTKRLGSDADGGISTGDAACGLRPLPGGHMKNRISSASRRVVSVGLALVLVTAAWDRPAHAVESKEVIVVNTPTVDARQSGTWDVGIDRVRIPFQEKLHADIPSGQFAGHDEFVVPAGHRLVIEQVTAVTSLTPPGEVVVPFFQVTTMVGGVLTDHFIPVTPAVSQFFVGCQQVRLYADPETTVTFTALRNTAIAGSGLTAGSISGYLIPMP
jgi:hypothetical protein